MRCDELDVVAELVEAEPAVELFRPVVPVGDEEYELRAVPPGKVDCGEDDRARVPAAAVLVHGADVLDLRVGRVLVEVGVARDLAVDLEREEPGLDASRDELLAGEELRHHLRRSPWLAGDDAVASRAERLLVDFLDHAEIAVALGLAKLRHHEVAADQPAPLGEERRETLAELGVLDVD